MRFLLSAITLISFVFNISVYANTDPFPDVIEKANRLDLDITNSWQGKSDKFILYIEDAHCNYLAQKEISKIIETMVSSGRFDLISVEGSSGEILTHLFSSFPTENTRKKIAENLLKSGFISGEEYFSIYNGNSLRIVGNDDEFLYRQNVSAFRNNFDSNPKASEILEDLKYGFFCIEEEYYNKPLFEFAKAYFSYNEGTADLKQFLNILSTSDVEEFISKYDQVQKLSCFIAKQNEFDYKLLDNHAGRIVDYLIRNTDKQTAKKVKNLVFKNLSGKIKQKHYYAELLKVSEGIVDEGLCRQLFLFRDLSDGMDDIDVSELNNQIVLLTKDCFEKLIRTDQEREVYQLAESYIEFTKVLNLNLTRSEYSKLHNGNSCVVGFKSFIEKYNGYSVAESVKNEDEQFLADLLKNNLNFYEIASKRDKFILENTLKILDKENLKNVVMIAGGFHSDEIFEDCKNRDISCVIVRPKVAGKNDLSKYASVVLRSDMYDRIFGVAPDKLRATSFFSENSFDDLAKISAFRREFIFTSVIDSIKSFEYKEVHDIIKNWRDGFSKAAGMRNPEGSVAYRNAMELFDYMVTDVFSYGNIQIDADSKSIVVSSADVTVRLKKNPDLSISVEQIKEPSKLEQGLALKQTPVVLQKTQVFISSWTIADETSEYFRHGDAHYSVKYIEAMNERGIEPIIILPSDSDEKARTLEKYAPAVKDRQYKFKFAEFDANGQIMEIDLDGKTVGKIDVDKTKRPTVIQLCSKIDSNNNQRIENLSVSLSNLTGVEPFFIRIPTAGTLLESAEDFDALDLYFNPLSSGFTQRFAVETGFVVDEEIINLAVDMKNRSVAGRKEDIFDQLSAMSKGKLRGYLSKLPGFGHYKQSGCIWSFRYLTEKDDAELASFMKAAKSSSESQIIFTFYSDKKDVDIKHKKFLKKHFAFVDLQQSRNNNLNKKSNVLIINLPPLDSKLFKGLMAVCDTAVVSGENSLVEGLILNKLGVGPTILFRPAMKEHMSILSNSLLSQGRQVVFDKVKEYADIKADPDTDYLSAEALEGNLNNSEQYISDVIFDPQMKELITSVFVGIVPPINGLNMMVDLIGKIDDGIPKGDLVKLYNFKTQNNAKELVESFLLDTSMEFDLSEGQSKFVKEHFKDFVKNFVSNLVELKVSSIDIKNLIGELSSQIISVYDLKLTELGVDNKADLTFTLERTINEFLSEMVITDNGHIFIPEMVHSRKAYEHTYLHQRVLEGANSKPSVISETLFEAEATRLIDDYNDLKYSRQFLKIFGYNPGNMFSYSRIIWQISGVAFSPDQLEVLNDRVAVLVLPRLREIAYEFSGNLIEVYGVANVETLLDYVLRHKIHTITQDDLKRYPLQWLRHHIDGLMRDIQTYDEYNSETGFFREGVHWVDSLESYFSDLIDQKVLFGDFSVSMKSIGSSFGREAYSMASVLVRVLQKYAYKNVYGHMEEGEAKADFVNRWIDQWDIKIYLLDRSPQHHAIAQEGVFSLLYIKEQEEDAFRKMSRVFGDDFVVVKDMLRKWIHPILVDFTEESFTLENTVSEVTFLMNILPYMVEDHQAKMINEVRHSFNPSYKSFFAYNIGFSSQPIDFNVVSDPNKQRYVLSPTKLPNCTNVFLGLLNQDFKSREEVVAFFGISDEDFDQIMNKADFSESRLFAPMLEKMLDDFFADKIGRIDSELTANTLIETKLTDLAWTIMQLLPDLGAASNLVNEMLVSVADQFIDSYESKLIDSGVTNTQYLVDSFKTNIGKFVDGVETVGGEHLFVPVISEYTDLYQHRFIRRQVFLSDSEDITIEKISKNVKDELVSDLRDSEYVFNLLPDIYFETAFPMGEFSDELVDNYKTQDQKNLSRKYVAFVYLGQFKKLAEKYSNKLKTRHGLSGLKALSKQLLSTYPKFGRNNVDNFERWEISLCEEHRALIKTIYLGDVDATSAGTTWFFRNETIWRSGLEAYLDDIITRKELLGDLSLSVKSLGASTGREAYSIASVIEQRLILFAEKHIFDGIKTPVVRDKLINEWVDSWNIKIYAFDKVPQRLVVGVEAVYEYIYEIRNNMDTFFDENPQFKEMLEDVNELTDGRLQTFRVKDRLRRWFVPVYCDMDKDVSMLEEYPSEITFAMNMFKYTDDFEKIKQAVLNTPKNDEKSFFAFNTVLNGPLIRHGEFTDQPAVVPPSVLPTMEEIVLTILSSRIVLESELCSYFGISPEELSSILQADTADVVDRLQVTRFAMGRETNKFLNHITPDLDTFEKQTDVIETHFLELIASVSEVFSGYGLSAQDVDKYLVKLMKEIVDTYYSRLHKTGVHNVYELVKTSITGWQSTWNL